MSLGTVAVVLNYRTAAGTMRAVRALAASHAKPRATIVVDNASGDGSLATLREHLPDVQFIAASENGGFSAGCNLGIREALRLGAGRVLLLNSDALLKPDTLGALEHALESDSRLGIVGPMVVESSDPQMIQSLGISYNQTTGRMRHYRFGHRRDAGEIPPLREVDGVSGCTMLIRRDVLEAVGLFFEDYFYGFEDLDLCLRARRAGFTTACVGSTIVLHEGSVSIGRASARRIYFATRNHLLLAQRSSPSASPVERWLRTASIAALNLGYVLVRPAVPRRQGLAAFVQALADRRAGRYGPGPS